MRLGRCTWTDSGVRCGCPAERLCEIPGREWLKMYPVCLCHPPVVDLGGPAPDHGCSDDLDDEAALLIKETERFLAEHRE